MATPSSISVTEGSGKNIATHSISETTTKELQRIELNTSAGVELGNAATPLQVSLANTGANSTKILVTPDSVALPSNQSVNVSQINGVTPNMGSGTGNTGTLRVSQATDSNVSVVGSGASGATLSSNPVTAGGLGATSNPIAVTNGQIVNTLHDKLGKQVVVGSIRDLKADAVVTLTSTTTETTLLAQVASIFLDVYSIIASNSSATATELTFRDTTGGSARFYLYVPAGETRGFMLPESAAWKQATVNTNWTVQSSQSISSVKVAVQAVKNI